MRKSSLLVLGLLLLIPPVLRAQDEMGEAPKPEAPKPQGDAVTAQVPKLSPFCVRVASVDRVDVLAKEILPVLVSLGFDDLGPLKELPPSGVFFALSGLDSASVDKTKPVYLAMTDAEDPCLVFHPAEGLAWEGQQELKDGHAAVLRGGAVVCSPARSIAVEARGAPTRFLDGGDVVFHVYLGDLAERYKEDIETGAAEIAMQAGAAPGMPDALKALVLPLVSGGKEAIFSVDSFDYALTWRADRIECEGLLRTKSRSRLREFFKRAGAPRQNNDLIGYLPEGAFIVTDASITADWPMREIAALLDAAAGEGVSKAVLTLMGASAAFTEHMTGRTATAVTLGGMMGMGGSSTSISELKEGTDFNAAVEKFDVAAVNAVMTKLTIPISLSLEKAVAKHGETALHRLSIQSQEPQLAMMFAMMQTYFAGEGRHMVTVMSPTAEDDIRALLDKIRQGAPGETPHTKAMTRLGKHNIGVTFDIGALKPMLQMMMMWMPSEEVQQAINHLPDELLFSTAISFNDGDIHWRGDWPSKEIVKVAQAIQAAKEKAAKPEEEDDFD